jgi:hypothetical protein
MAPGLASGTPQRVVLPVVLGAIVIALLITSIGQRDETTNPPAPFTINETERIVKGAYQAELESRRRERRMDGSVAVLEVQCAKRPAARPTLCLAQVARSGGARELTPALVTIRVRRSATSRKLRWATVSRGLSGRSG